MSTSSKVYGLAFLATFVLFGWPAKITASPPSEPQVPRASAVTLTGYWAKAVRIAEAREDEYLRSCDSSVDNYTVSVWEDQKYYYVRFASKAGTNGKYPTDYVEDVISKGTFDVLRDFKY